MKYYTAYGLQIASELPLPELVASSAQTPDLHIRYGSVPMALPNSHQCDGFFQAVPGTLLLTVPEVARFLVVEGREVWIERELNSEDADVRIFLLGSVLGALLHLRHILALHASSIKAFHSKCSFHIGAIKYFVCNYNVLKAKAQCQHYIDITTNRPITPTWASVSRRNSTLPS